LRIIAVEHHCNALKSARQWLLSAAILWRTDRVVYLTGTYRDEVKRKLGPLFRPRNTGIIPNGLDLDACVPRNPANAEFTAGMQGRMVDGKDFPTLLRAVALANAGGGPRIRLELAGDGPRRPELEALTDSLGIRSLVTFTGLLDHAALLQRVAGWHAYAHASMGETMSIAIMEAKACALPIVASDAPGISPFFKDGENGLLVPPGNAAAMAAALQRLASAPDLCARLGMAARREAEERYSAARAWKSYRQVLFPSAAETLTTPATAPVSVSL
jgi:glycosyltransferase involved in cell wall biosynthesis